MKSTQTGIAVALAVAVVAVIFIFPGLSPFGQTSSQPTEEALDTTNTASSTSTTMPTDNTDQLQITDEVVGTGATLASGDIAVMQYTGMFTDGKVFDSSVGKQAIAISPCPEGATTGLCFTVNGNQVIKGWDTGVIGMKEGGKRRLVIPSSLGYGSKPVTNPSTGQVIIPANSTLVFEVELLKVQKAQ